MVWTRGIWTPKAGCEDEFVAAWQEFASWTRGEYAGAHAWLLRDRDHPGVFMTIGPFGSDDIVAAWRASDGFRERVARIRGLLDAFEPGTFDQVLEIA